MTTAPPRTTPTVLICSVRILVSLKSCPGLMCNDSEKLAFAGVQKTYDFNLSFHVVFLQRTAKKVNRFKTHVQNHCSAQTVRLVAFSLPSP